MSSVAVALDTFNMQVIQHFVFLIVVGILICIQFRIIFVSTANDFSWSTPTTSGIDRWYKIVVVVIN